MFKIKANIYILYLCIAYNNTIILMFAYQLYLIAKKRIDTCKMYVLCL